MDSETLEQVQTRHRRELKDLQGRITNKKKNATKKTRKGVNDECAEMERSLREKQAGELAVLSGDAAAEDETRQEEDEALAKEASQKLHVHTPAPAKEATQQQEAGGKQKRNRQKERLARRAAEQEAATQRAEDEASRMTNHRALESAYMTAAMNAAGLVEQDIAPDGHCLFAAVADQLQTQLSLPLDVGDGKGAAGVDRKEPAYKTVRRAAAEYMTAHADDFAPFVEGDDFDGHVRRIRDTAEWGGEPELMALARAYGVGIRVVQDGRTETIGDEPNKGVVWLAYYRHGYGLGEHYNSLRRT